MKQIIVLVASLLVAISQSEGSSLSGLKLSPAIVNGVNPIAGEATYVVQVRKRITVNEYNVAETLCGGVLISPRTVITSARCVDMLTGGTVYQNLYIRYGTYLLDRSPYPDVNVSRVYKHPDYSFNLNRNDIAVLTLETRIEACAKIVDFARLYTEDLFVEEKVTIYGWGKTSGDSLHASPILQKVQLHTLCQGRCVEQLAIIGYPANPNVLCAAAPDATSCAGDLGGPLIASDGRLVGIASLGQIGCTPGGLNIYTKISAYYNFIRRYTVIA